MAFAGRTTIIKDTPANILTAINAIKAAATIVGVSMSNDGKDIWTVAVAYDTTAAGGQTVVIAPVGLNAATITTLNTAAALATVSIDVLEIESFGEFNSGGIIVYK